MPDESVKQRIRRIKRSASNILDRESFNVAEAKGKLSEVVDLVCFDKSGLRLVKVCEEKISNSELSKILHYSDALLDTSTILQIDFWKKNGRKPFYRAKLYYNKPNQIINNELKKLIQDN